MLAVSALLLPATAAYQVGLAPRAQVSVRAVAPVMDETIIQKALAGGLEKEGADNIFMSEVGWATYLDSKEGGSSSYAMNERPSKAQDGYFTASILDNPAQGKALPVPRYLG